MKRRIPAVILTVVYAALTVRAYPADGPISPLKIVVPRMLSVQPEVDVPEKITVVEEITPGTSGVEPEVLGEKKANYYGGLIWKGGGSGLEYVSPLEKDETAGKAHYELIYHGNFLTETIYRDPEGHPKVDENHYAAMVRNRYDKNENLVEESSYGADGRLKNDWYGFAIYRWSYDDENRRTSGAFYGTDGKLTHKKFSEVAVSHWAFDDEGNQILWANYDMKGRLTNDVLGVAAWTYRYDEEGRKVLVVSYGADRKPTIGKNGYAAILMRYDEKGNVKESSYYGEDMRLVRSRSISIYRFIYGPNGKLSETAFYNSEGHLSRNEEGLAIIMDLYDEAGDKTRQKAYNEKKQLIDDLELDAKTGKWNSVTGKTSGKGE